MTQARSTASLTPVTSAASASFGPETLELDAPLEIERITSAIKQQARHTNGRCRSSRWRSWRT